MSFFIKDEDVVNKPIRTFKYLKKGEGRKAHNSYNGPTHVFLKKGKGKLVSENHGETDFAKQRKIKITTEQEKREQDFQSEE